MKNNSYLSNYHDDDVCSFASAMFKVARFRQAVSASIEQLEEALKNALKAQRVEINTEVYTHNLRQPHQQRWFGEGIDCEILNVGAKGWQKGKMKIIVSLEFCPDELEIKETPATDELETSKPDSPLDDIRQMMK